MAAKPTETPLEAVMAEYTANLSAGWKPKTKVHYQANFTTLLNWLRETGRPTTSASLDFRTLLEFGNHLRSQPAARGVWRGDHAAVARARRESFAPRISATFGRQAKRSSTRSSELAITFNSRDSGNLVGRSAMQGSWVWTGSVGLTGERGARPETRAGRGAVRRVQTGSYQVMIRPTRAIKPAPSR
jgi:hypothetical protein